MSDCIRPPAGGRSGAGGATSGSDVPTFSLPPIDGPSYTTIGGRIVGGEMLDYPRQYQFLVSLQSRSGFPFCGGTLISSRWVLTAAHCTQSATYQVQIGVHSQSSAESTDAACVVTKRVVRTINHAQYSDRSLINDISLLELCALPPDCQPLLRPSTRPLPRQAARCHPTRTGHSVTHPPTHPLFCHTASLTSSTSQ